MQRFWDATSAYNAWKTIVHQILPKAFCRCNHREPANITTHTHCKSPILRHQNTIPPLQHSPNPSHQNFPALDNAPTHRNSPNYQNSPTRYNSSTPQLTHTAKPPHRKSPTPKLSLCEYPTLLPAHAANLSCDNPPTHFATYPNRNPPKRQPI